MAEDHDRPRKENKGASWWKIFTAFKVALDPKKLLLAGIGILVTALGWWFWSIVFDSFTSMPVPEGYLQGKPEENEADFQSFRRARDRWNFLHRVAGRGHVPYDLGDFAASFQEYTQGKEYLDAEERLNATAEIKVDENDKQYYLHIAKDKFALAEADAKNPVLELVPKTIQLREMEVLLPDRIQMRVVGVPRVIRLTDEKKIEKLKLDLEEPFKIHNKIATELNIPALVAKVNERHIKPAGEFRTFPWFEDRGPNQYLVVAKAIEQAGKDKRPGQLQQENPKNLALAQLETRTTLAFLFEPLVKFLKPVVYFFDERAGGFVNRLYLILIILWTITVWSFVGGAITRMAAVQVARNEKVGFTEALQFARSRWQSFFSAPVLPLVLLGFLTAFLWFFGLVVLGIPILGELLAGFFWPVVLLVGLIMAVVLVGLLGWPLMNATISSEGSDSFDALSRSYSYVYQAPWHYIWYSFLALVYGAVLVFFVGFMGSLLVYLGKWGINQAPSWKARNDPSFLFVHAPTSFGWRNLLMHDSPNVEPVRTAAGVMPDYRLKKDYQDSIQWYNKVGAYLVTFWLALFFLLIVGFGYSYFWTATAIIYLLMRQKVDDTDLDEIHLEEEERDLPFMPEKPSTPAAAPASSNPPGVTFTMVEAPQLRPSTPPASPPAVVAPPPAETPSTGNPEPNSPPPEGSM